MYSLLLGFILLHPCLSEFERTLKILESVPLGTHVGFVTETPPENTERSNFDIVFPDPNSQGEKLFSVNIKTGEISTIATLDYETESRFVFLAIPMNGSTTIKVTIELEDVNDNTPQFSVGKIYLEVSEYARIGLELPLPVAVDPDSPKYSVKKYRIAGGNVNNVFRIANRHRNEVLYADLVVNGQLDREYRDHYNLLVEAVDGGDPPKVGKIEVVVNILDANDNPPVFSQHRYLGKVSSNATIGTEVITVSAKDADFGENAKDLDGGSSKFQIDSKTGVVRLAEESIAPGENYELTVIASDHGKPKHLESTTFLTINVENVEKSSQSRINIVWLTDDGLPNLWENLTLGYVLARASIETEHSGNLSLIGTDSLCLKQTDKPTVYLVLVCRPLDRERQHEYRLQFQLQSERGDTLVDHPIHVEILDINDNAPVWNQTQFHVVFTRTHSLSQKNVYRFLPKDPDAGENARIRYSLSETSRFEIDPETGVLKATNELPCNNGSEIRIKVIATDFGHPPLSSSADVIVDVVEAYKKPPIFSKTLYEINVREDAEIGTCLLQVG